MSRSKLDACLEKFSELVQTLQEKHLQFHNMSSLAVRDADRLSPPVLEVFFRANTNDGPLVLDAPPLPPEIIRQALQSHLDKTGREIMADWDQLFEVAKEAFQHCQAAKQQQ